ncbi:MAG: AAA family ATPase [Patescibacteria group bacterium]|jgi:dephospho-CoA kinase
MNKIIIGLVGEIASGKDTLVDYLQKNYQATTHKFSASLRDILNRLYLDISRENLQKLSQILRENFNQNLLSKVIAGDVKNDDNKIIVINGVRRLTDIEYLKKLPEFHLIYVTADLDKRHKRIVSREENEDDKNKTLEQFKVDEQAEAEQQIPKVAQIANYRIDNNGTIDDLYRQIDKIINEIIKL